MMEMVHLKMEKFPQEQNLEAIRFKQFFFSFRGVDSLTNEKLYHFEDVEIFY